MTETITPSTDAPLTVVRMSGGQGLVAGIPQILGFEPTDSLVLACLHGECRRVGPLARIDLFPSGRRGVTDAVVNMACRYADEVIIVVYHEGPRPDCVDDLRRAIRRCRIPIAGVWSVSQGRIRDASSQPRYARDQGIPVLGPEDSQSLAITSAFALAGRAALPSRAALAHSITPSPDEDDSPIRQSIDSHTESLRPFFNAAGEDWQISPELAAMVDSALATAVQAREGSGTIDDDHCARVIALSRHRGCRDRLMGKGVCSDNRPVLDALVSIAARCPDDVCPDLCAVLAACAYRAGEGALAHCALDRAQRARPQHRLAKLLRALVDHGIAPTELESLAETSGITEDTRVHGTVSRKGGEPDARQC